MVGCDGELMGSLRTVDRGVDSDGAPVCVWANLLGVVAWKEPNLGPLRNGGRIGVVCSQGLEAARDHRFGARFCTRHAPSCLSPAHTQSARRGLHPRRTSKLFNSQIQFSEANSTAAVTMTCLLVCRRLRGSS